MNTKLRAIWMGVIALMSLAFGQNVIALGQTNQCNRFTGQVTKLEPDQSPGGRGSWRVSVRVKDYCKNPADPEDWDTTIWSTKTHYTLTWGIEGGLRDEKLVVNDGVVPNEKHIHEYTTIFHTKRYYPPSEPLGEELLRAEITAVEADTK